MNVTRRRLSLTGLVQGLGVRPFVYNLARDLGLSGFVQNTSGGLLVEVQGPEMRLDEFALRLRSEKPPLVEFRKWEEQNCAVDLSGENFSIRESSEDNQRSSWVLPDLAMCPECRSEIFNSQERRYRYPFTNCTYCGPRYSIIAGLPYDRPRTSMARFAMCESCRSEYEDPTNRRFHAQPIACADCGPQVELWNSQGEVLFCREQALAQAVAVLRRGEILAVKGLGGFHLLVDAENGEAVARLRQRKRRGDKPFAVMFNSLEAVQAVASVSETASSWLTSSVQPIVLVRCHDQVKWADSAPRQNYLGVVLPYTPLHALLLSDFGRPVVCTSGNLSEEPICIDEHEALAKLSGIADALLVHNRPILRAVEDSVLQVVGGRPMVLRRGRGLAPSVWPSADEAATVSFALGGDLKHAMGIARGQEFILGTHVGDVAEAEAYAQMVSEVKSWREFFAVKDPTYLVDCHPQYHTHQWAWSQSQKVAELQHHRAHVWSLWAEHGGPQEDFAVVWDGSGLGEDGSIWGGEFLVGGSDGNLLRWGSLRPFQLFGGDRGVRDCRRSAWSLLTDTLGESWSSAVGWPQEFLPSAGELALFQCKSGRPSWPTTSMGRIFDAVAAILGLVAKPVSFEGQAAMLLQAQAELSDQVSAPFTWEWIQHDGLWQADWRPMIRALVEELGRGARVPELARRFHLSLVQMIMVGWQLQRPRSRRMIVAGGCFQNKLLLELLIERCQQEQIEVAWPQLNPPNDGGLALGQLAWWKFQQRKKTCV